MSTGRTEMQTTEIGKIGIVRKNAAGNVVVVTVAVAVETERGEGE